MLESLSLSHVIYVSDGEYKYSCILYLRILHEKIYSPYYTISYCLSHSGDSPIFTWMIFLLRWWLIFCANTIVKEILDNSYIIIISFYYNESMITIFIHWWNLHAISYKYVSRNENTLQSKCCGYTIFEQICLIMIVVIPFFLPSFFESFS